MTSVTKFQAFIIMIAIISIISTSLLFFSTTPHIPIVLIIFLLILFSIVTNRVQSLFEGIKNGMTAVITPLVLFILIGMLISVLMLSGTIPTIMYYGSQIMSITYFLPSVFFLSAIIGSSLGSAFTTVSTVGVAFMTIGLLIGFPAPIIAGAIISGACLGDKMSPLSDTTNLAATVCKVDLFEHIKHMLWTTGPAFILTTILSFILGSRITFIPKHDIFHHLDPLLETGLISKISILPLLVMFFFAWKKKSAIVVLFFGILAALVVSLLVHQHMQITTIMKVVIDGFSITTGDEKIDQMLNRGGILSMFWSISLVVLTLTMGGIIQAFGVLTKLMEFIRNWAVSTAKLVMATVLTAIGINVTVGEQYLSILLTGNVFREEYKKRGLKGRTLSRTLEDAGTVINPLIPYGVSGVFMASVLNVSVLDYLPYAFFCLLCPLLSVFLGLTGISIKYK